MTLSDLLPPPAQRLVPWGSVLSVTAHVAIIAVVLAISAMPRRIDVPPAPASIAVDLLTPQQFAALSTPPAPVPSPVEALPLPRAEPLAPAVEQPAPKTPVSPVAPAAPTTVHATRFFAAAILAAPENRRIREALPTLGHDERIVQLCNIEGLEQIRRADPRRDPDTLVAYAMGDTSIAGGVLTALGGAFRSRRNWYRASFRCAVATDFSHVEAFDLTLGEPIPREQWESHDLSEADAEE